jgi:hypothetical protein
MVHSCVLIGLPFLSLEGFSFFFFVGSFFSLFFLEIG